MAFWPKKPEEWSPQTVRAEPANGFMSSGANVRKADISPFVPTAPKAPTPATLPATRSASPAPVAPIVPQPGKNNAANANALAMQRFGEIVSVFMRSAQHRTLTLADIERLVLPAVATGQFMLAEAEVKATGAKQPVAVVLWARVSSEVEQRLGQQLNQPMQISPQDWKSSDLIWIVESVGDGKVVEALLKRMVQTVWAGKTVKLRACGKDGRMAVGELSSRWAGSLVN